MSAEDPPSGDEGGEGTATEEAGVTRSTRAILALATIAATALEVRAIGQTSENERTFAGGPISESAILAAISTAHPISFRPVGTTSLTFQVDLMGPVDAAFRPESRAHPRGWLAEVAAYRLARELGLDNVPPAVLRSIDRGSLRRRLDPAADVNFESLEPQIVWSGAVVRGAFVYWVPGLQRSDLDSAQGIARWSAWLSQGGEIPEEHRALARDLANLVVFDYLIANRDRWSGGNVRPIEGGRLVIRDHNLAFAYQLGEAQHRRMLAFLKRAQRFSRSMIERLARLDEGRLRAALDNPPNVTRILDDRQIEGVLDRRGAILSYVGALIEAHGEDAVLCFE